MGDEAANVAKNLNSFGQHLSDEGIDFHLIVVEKDMSSVRLCVEPPLADKTCTSKVAGKKIFIHLIFTMIYLLVQVVLLVIILYVAHFY